MAVEGRVALGLFPSLLGPFSPGQMQALLRNLTNQQAGCESCIDDSFTGEIARIRCGNSKKHGVRLQPFITFTAHYASPSHPARWDQKPTRPSYPMATPRLYTPGPNQVAYKGSYVWARGPQVNVSLMYGAVLVITPLDYGTCVVRLTLKRG